MFYSFVSKMREIHNKIENKTYVQLVHIYISGLLVFCVFDIVFNNDNTHLTFYKIITICVFSQKWLLWFMH